MNRRTLSATLRLLRVPGVLLALALASISGCGKANPTAPSGSTLTLTVNPVTLVSPTGSATLNAHLRRPNGTPEPGAQVQFTSTLGNINPATVTTDSNGSANSTLTGDGRIGTAKVTAFSGAVMSSEVDVTVGAQEASIVLVANPSTVRQDGGKIDLTAQVRDAQGNPVPNSPVVFSAQAGSFRDNGFASTDSSGIARDTLVISSSDLNNQSGDTFNVSVSGNGSGTGAGATFAVNIARPPVAAFTATVAPGVGSLSVSFTDNSTHHPTSWKWDFGDGTPTSNAANPAHTYKVKGTYTVTLTVTNAVDPSGTGSEVTSQAVCVNCGA